MRNTILLIIVFMVVILAALVITNGSKVSKDINQKVTDYNIDTDVKLTPAQQKNPTPEMIIDKNKKYAVTLATTAGDITIELDTKATPITANNFVYLANKNFYNNTIFHRVIKGFMIQGGDPNGDGTGGPGYSFDDEKIVGDYKRGVVAMANSGPNTNGSQFFIMQKDTELPKNYVIFGKVVKGMETVDSIAEEQVTDNGAGEESKPVNPAKIILVKVAESSFIAP